MEKINFIDIGSIGGLPLPWRNHPELINYILNFEPNSEVERTENSITYNTAVWESDSELPFYIYKGLNATGSSLFKQNYNYVRDHWDELKSRGPKNLADTWFDRSSPVETKVLQCRSLDNILSEEAQKISFDFLKIDAQGAEFNILKGAHQFLNNDCVGLHLELFLIPLYEGIALLDEVKEFLESYGFELVKKFPVHGSFDSQHDCVFVHTSRKPEVAKIIYEIYAIKKA